MGGEKKMVEEGAKCEGEGWRTQKEETFSGRRHEERGRVRGRCGPPEISPSVDMSITFTSSDSKSITTATGLTTEESCSPQLVS